MKQDQRTRPRIHVAAVAALLTTPAIAQIAPPPVPQYRCNNPPVALFQQQAAQLGAAQFIMVYVNSAIESWTQACERDYRGRMLQWQAQMQRIEMLNRQRYGN